MLGFIKDLVSGTSSGLLEGAGEFLKDARQAITGEPDVEKQMQAYKELAEMQFQWGLQEARHKSIFVAGWRPWVGWICGTAFGYHFIIHPLLMWAAAILGFTPPPKIDISELSSLLYGMLGMGALRSFDKVKGNG